MKKSNLEKKALCTQSILNKSLGKVQKALNDGPGFMPKGAYESKYFLSGSSAIIKKPAENARWHLGYALVDLTPTDIKEHDYYLGGYKTIENGFHNKVNSVIDKMMCRIICMDDNSGRGASLFAVTDCIGLGNADILRIRRHFFDLLKINGIPAHIASVNVCSTHTHSCIDTQGLWTDTGKKLIHNLIKNKTGRGTYVRGADEEYINALILKIGQGLLEAYCAMTPGTLTFACKDIGTDYFNNKNRSSATALDTRINRFVFTPDDNTIRPTIIVNLAAHPDVAGLPTTDGQGTGRDLCGEYIYYMGSQINKAGYNFMFLNGAICAIYMARNASNDGVTFYHRYEQSIRYGIELANITLSLTKTEDEIRQNPLLYNPEEIARDTEIANRNHSEYTLWCKNWQPVTETEIAPLLNVRLTRVEIPVTNPLIQIVGKLNLVDYRVLTHPNHSYSLCTETGFVQIGHDFTAVMVPGEFCQDLLSGGKSLTAEGSFHHRDFALPPLTNVFGDCRAFGLSNDAIGYIVPDNDYILGEFSNHYHELISLGEQTGSSVLKALFSLKEQADKECKA